MQLRKLKELSITVSGSLVLIIALAIFLRFSSVPILKIGSLVLALVAVGILASTDRWSALILRWLLSGALFTAGLFVESSQHYGLLKTSPHTTADFLAFAGRWFGLWGVILITAFGFRQLIPAIRKWVQK